MKGRRMDRFGYVRIWQPDHPLATKHGYVAEHRKVVYDAGIPVGPGDHVHHLNGDKADNRLENLEVLTHGEHTLRHARLQADECSREGCSKRPRARGLCSTHYSQWWWERKRAEV